MRKMIIVLSLIAAMITGIMFPLSAIADETEKAEEEKAIVLSDRAVFHDTKFGGVWVQAGTAEFADLGFELGDSVDILFSNGYSLTDIPYYNGFYVDIDEPVLYASGSEKRIKVQVNYGDDVWLTAGLDDDSTVSISLHEAGKYLAGQQAGDLTYSDEQGLLSDEVFANFRCVEAGSILPGTLYRSASPCDNARSRAAVTDRLCEQAGIRYILDLADSDEDIMRYYQAEDFNSPYFLKLYKFGTVSTLDLSMQFRTEEFASALVKGLTDMAGHEGPYLVNCQEGKDRTGFVCMLLEALAGATEEEIVADYMKTFENYYGITEETDSVRYEAVRSKNIDLMLGYISSLGGDTLAENVEIYLENAGMDKGDIEKLREKLCG